MKNVNTPNLTNNGLACGGVKYVDTDFGIISFHKLQTDFRSNLTISEEKTSSSPFIKNKKNQICACTHVRCIFLTIQLILLYK